MAARQAAGINPARVSDPVGGRQTVWDVKYTADDDPHLGLQPFPTAKRDTAGPRRAGERRSGSVLSLVWLSKHDAAAFPRVGGAFWARGIHASQPQGPIGPLPSTCNTATALTLLGFPAGAPQHDPQHLPQLVTQQHRANGRSSAGSGGGSMGLSRRDPAERI